MADQVVDSPCQGVTGAVHSASALLMDRLIFDPILLVGNGQGDFMGSHELVEAGGVRDGGSTGCSEDNILEFKSCSEGCRLGWLGVLPDSEEIIKGNVDEVCNGHIAVCGVGVVVDCVENVFDEAHRDRYLASPGRVFPVIAPELAAQALFVFFASRGIFDGVLEAIQFELRADGTKRVLN